MCSSEDCRNGYIALYIADRDAPKEEVKTITCSLSLHLYSDNKLSTANEPGPLKRGSYDIRLKSIRKNGAILRKMALYHRRDMAPGVHHIDDATSEIATTTSSADVLPHRSSVVASADEQSSSGHAQGPPSDTAANGRHLNLDGSTPRSNQTETLFDTYTLPATSSKSVAFADIVQVRAMSPQSDEDSEEVKTSQQTIDTSHCQANHPVEPFADDDSSGDDDDKGRFDNVFADEYGGQLRGRTRIPKKKALGADNRGGDGSVADRGGVSDKELANSGRRHRKVLRDKEASKRSWRGSQGQVSHPRKRVRTSKLSDQDGNENDRNLIGNGDYADIDTYDIDESDDDTDVDYRPPSSFSCRANQGAGKRRRTAQSPADRHSTSQSPGSKTDTVDIAGYSQQQIELYVCDICGSGYGKRKKLLSHQKKRHSK